jgi:hypothetical protein
VSDTYKVRLGVSAARELEFDVEDPDAVSVAYEKAVKKGDAILWFTDARGHRFGVTVESIAFVELEQPQDRGVGFGLG